MRYTDLLLAHGAFYQFERRAKYYDEYLSKRRDDLWNSPLVPIDEIEELFKFIRLWDFHFRGDIEKFQSIYAEIFPTLCDLEGLSIITLDFSNEDVLNGIGEVFSQIANCSYDGSFQSTDASKIVHTLNPELFVMWDRNIRKEILGNANIMYSDYYVSNFLPKIRDELEEAISSCMDNSSFNYSDSIKVIMEITNGKTLSKLADQYNYMCYTRPAEFSAYKSNVKPNIKDMLLKKPLEDTIDLWRQQVTEHKFSDKQQFADFINILNELKELKIINMKEWRDYSEKWQKNLEDRDFLGNLLKEKIDRYSINSY